MGAEFSISNQFMVPHIITALGSKCVVPQFTHTGTCGGFSAHLLFWPNHNCDIPKELGEPHALSAEIIFLREIVNISSRQWNHRTTSPPGAGAAVGAGKVVLQYQLQSEISNLEISFFFSEYCDTNTSRHFLVTYSTWKEESSWTAETPLRNHLSTK